MSAEEGTSLHLPKLPELAEEDVKAIRSFLPGKLLGRTAVLLSLILMVIGFAALVDQGFNRIFVNKLVLSPWQHFGVLFGLPLGITVAQLWIELNSARARRLLQSQAVQTGAVPQGYFRIGPYLDTAADRGMFTRADGAHEKVLNWIKKHTDTPIYLTGDSGSGKSSLLNAFVLPNLREEGWTVVEARAWQDPVGAIFDALSQLPSVIRSRIDEPQNLRGLVELVSRKAKKGLLLVVDQFEEFLILGNYETHRRFVNIISELRSNPIHGFCLLLSLRSNYLSLLGDIGLPPLRHGENFCQVGRFTLGAASRFMGQSNLGLTPEALDQLLKSAAVMDETLGLIRPITLNVLGYVLTNGGAVAQSLDAGQLVRFYIQQAVEQPTIREIAGSILERLVTEQGTKQPRTERELMDGARLRRGEVRGVLNALALAALVRPLDADQGVWELSHDFVARAIARYLGRQRRNLIRRSGFYAAPALLGLALLVGTGDALWDRYRPLELRWELNELGISIVTVPGGLRASIDNQSTPGDFLKAVPLLSRLGPSALTSLDLRSGMVTDATPLKGLTALTSLYLRGTEITDATPLRGLTALTWLDLSNTKITDATPLKGLTALTSLYLSGTAITDATPLKGLTALTSLGLDGTGVTDAMPLQDLTALSLLNLDGTGVTDATPLQNLTALTLLSLDGTGVKDAMPLKGLTALTSLDLRGTRITDAMPLKGLTALRWLGLGNTRITDATPLKDLTALRWLDLSGTETTDAAPLRGLTVLTWLDLSNTKITDATPLKGLTALTSLDLGGTRITDATPLKGLTALTTLDLSGTRITDATPLKGLTGLTSLDLRYTGITDLSPVQNVSDLEIPELIPTNELTRYQAYRKEKRLLPPCGSTAVQNSRLLQEKLSC